MQRLLLFAVLSGLALQASAATVLYTDRNHPPVSLIDDVEVIWLDAPDTVQQQAFGDLPADLAEAERQILKLRQSPDWEHQQQKITDAYQGVLKAWQLGIRKVPAVVFDDARVVYGTADIQRAQALLAKAQ